MRPDPYAPEEGQFDDISVWNLEKNPAVRDSLTVMRDRTTDNATYREATRNLARDMFPFVAESLPDRRETVETPLDTDAEGARIRQPDVMPIAVMRAGNPVAEEMLERLPGSDMGVIDAWREHDLSVETSVRKLPPLEGRTAYVCDPMIATGNTMTAVYESITEDRSPEDFVVQAYVAVDEGLHQMDDVFPAGTDVYTAAVDPELNDHGYIVPGLGDAGDRTYGDPT